MNKTVQLIITIENDEQADKVLKVLNEAEENGELDFAFNTERVTEDTFSFTEEEFTNKLAPTFGDKNDPLI